MQQKRNVLIPFALILLFLCGCDNGKIHLFFKNYRDQGGRIEKVRTLAILDFCSKEGTGVEEALAYHLRLSGYLTVMEPAESRKILAEKGFPRGGAISQEEAGKIADLLGVDALIFGDAVAGFTTSIRYKEPDFGPVYYYYTGCRRFFPTRWISPVPYLHREGCVNMKLLFYDRHLGNSLGALELKTSYDRDFDFFYFRGTRPDGRYYFDRAYQSPMPSDSEMLYLMADRLLSRLTEQLLPLFIDETRMLQKGMPGDMPAEEGKWDQAKAIWEKSLLSGAENWKILSNLGIYYERRGEPGKAISLYEKALQGSPGNTMIIDYARQARQAADARSLAAPLEGPQSLQKYKIVEIKDDGRIYINAGEEESLQPGDTFAIARYRVDFDSSITTPRGGHYYRIGTVTVEKVFKGVSQGRFTHSMGGSLPVKDDGAWKIGR